MSPLWIEIIKGMFTLAAAAVAAFVALRMYFRQKEYELIKQRYLEGAVDAIAGEVELVLGVVNHNWARSLQLVKAFRDNSAHFDLAELDKGWLPLEATRFQRISHHRLRSLTNSDVYWGAYQLVMAYASTANSLARNELPEAIRVKMRTNDVAMPVADLAEKMAEALWQSDGESHRFAHLVRELHELGRILETERLNFKTVSKFHERPAVKDSVSRLAKEFAKDLQVVRGGLPNNALERQ